jgi:hypothetical protein
MNRRGFLRLAIGGVAASAAVRTFPFRVYSFPKEIIAPKAADIEWLNMEPDPEPFWVYRVVFVDGHGFVRTGERYKSLYDSMGTRHPYVSP